MPRSVRQLIVAMTAIVVLAGPATAQDMTTSDVSRLQSSIDQIEEDLTRLRRTDRISARNFQTELMDLQDEVIYLKVKLRKERNVPRASYVDVRDRIENLRSRVSGNDNSTGAYSTGGSNTDRDRSTTVNSATPGTVPVGTELDVRLSTALSSDTAQVEDRFEATTVVDLRENGRVLIPAGSVVRGVVTDVKEAGRLDRKGSLSLSFDQITINGRNYPMRGSITQVLESGGYRDREEAERIGAGAAVGGIIGGIIGGLKGALAGILIGGGGVIAATEGKDVELAPGTMLRMRLDQALAVRPAPTRQ